MNKKREVFPDTFIPESETGKQFQYYHLRFYTSRYGGLWITYLQIISLAFMGLTLSDCETRLTVNSKFFIWLWSFIIDTQIYNWGYIYHPQFSDEETRSPNVATPRKDSEAGLGCRPRRFYSRAYALNHWILYSFQMLN